MKRQSVINCVFSNWYPIFKDLTIESKIIKLHPEFIEYLLADGVVLPGSSSDADDLTHSVSNMDVIDDDNTDSDGWSNSGDEIESPKFPELENDIKNVIRCFGGSVFPKLNWSAPRDASWISSDGTLKCQCFQDICLLLKSSDFINHDLKNAFEYCEDSTASLPMDGFELVLRKWVNIAPASEFRCFVKRNKLIAVSQRDYTNFYEFLVKGKEKIHKEITNFFAKNVKSRFMDESYVFDVYRFGEGKMRVIDINPFSKVTDPLLFTWQELFDCCSDAYNEEWIMQGEMRIVTQMDSIQPSPYLSYRLPKDIDDIAAGGDINKLVEFLNEKKK